MNIDIEYKKLFNNELNIGVDYKKLFNNELIIAVDYILDLPTIINIGTSYQIDRTTEINNTVQYISMKPNAMLIGFLPIKDMPTVIHSDVVYAKEYAILWDQSADFSRFGGFKTIEEANRDAASKNYNDITIRKIINDNGVVYFTYRVNQNNDFVCGILAPKVPRYGLIRGG